MLGYVSYKRTGEIGWGTENSVGSFHYLWDTAMVQSVPVFNRESNKRDVCGVQRMVEEYAAGKVFFRDPERMTSLAEGRQIMEI